MQNITMSNIFDKISITKMLVIIDFFILDYSRVIKKTGESDTILM